MIRLNKKQGVDSIKNYRSALINPERDLHLLQRCETLWNNFSEFRDNLERATRYTYGDQWGDLITVNGRTMTERQYLVEQGNVALQTNLVKSFVTTMVGVWAKEQSEPVAHARDRKEQQYGELMSLVHQANWQNNKMKLLMMNALEQCVLGGAAFVREAWDRVEGRQDAYSFLCDPKYMFFDSVMKDPRFWDMSLIGEIHDITFNDFCRQFCKSPKDVDWARERYVEARKPIQEQESGNAIDKNNSDRLTFGSPLDPNLCRVYEIWTKEVKPRYHVHDQDKGTLEYIDADNYEELAAIKAENARRLELGRLSGWEDDEIPLIEMDYFIDSYWYFRFLTPDGFIIREGESPLPNRSHPYTVCLMPFTNGKVVSFIQDVIDQNRALNRILTLDDFIRRSGAKGVTMVPEQLVMDMGISKKEFAEQWTSYNGIMYYRAKPGVPEPKQFYGHTQTADTANLVRLFKDLMEQSTSLSGAIQGKTPYAGTSAALFAQQTQNSSTPIMPFMERFTAFVDDVAMKKLKFIQQYYDAKMYDEIAGTMNMDTASMNLAEMGYIEMDIAVKEGAESPVRRMLANDYLLQFWQAGAISLPMLLRHCHDLPFSDALLQELESQEAQMQAQQPQGNPGNVTQKGIEQMQAAASGGESTFGIR